MPVRSIRKEISLRGYQEEAVKACWDTCKKNLNPVIVLPTGAGKSLVIAQLIKELVGYNMRVLVLAHRKELLEQNAEEIANLAGCEVGVYSAGLKSRDEDADVLVAGIQSIYRKAGDIGRRHVVIIDEAHLVPTDEQTMYGRLMTDLGELNEFVRVIGLTATPYRTGSGDLTEMTGAWFDEVCYEAFVGDLIADGYLSNIVTKPADNGISTSSLPKARGDFVQSAVEEEFIKVAHNATDEVIRSTFDRKSIILFTAGVRHAEIVATRIAEQTGESVKVVTGSTPAAERDDYIADFKAGKIRWLVNVNVLTTGFNATRTDAVVVLRATTSPGLFAQMVGRGLRLHEGKSDCLVLDFGENVQRHGALDDKDYGRKPKSTSDGTGAAPMKICPACEQPNPVSVRVCGSCLTPFDIDPAEGAKHNEKADTQAPILKMYQNTVRAFNVDSWTLARHKGKGDKPDSLRVNYYVKEVDSDGEGNLSAADSISQWVCIQHEGFAYKKAKKWWAEVCGAPIPPDVQEALDLHADDMLRMPTRLFAKRKDGFWEITDMVFDCDRPTEPNSIVYTEDDIPF